MSKNLFDIGQTYNEHPDSLMRPDFEASLGYLDLMVQNDIRYDI